MAASLNNSLIVDLLILNCINTGPSSFESVRMILAPNVEYLACSRFPGVESQMLN